MTRLRAYPVYLIISAVSSFWIGMSRVVRPVYYVLIVHMNPLQLVLIGTTLELSYFLFQVPTGIFADTRSRRLSIVLGMCLGGTCSVIQGLFPVFAVIMLAEVGNGLAAALRDGAEDAWLSDEMGQENFGRATIRGSQVDQIMVVVAAVVAVALASIHLNVAIVLGGVLSLSLGVFLALVMPEHDFKVELSAHETPLPVTSGALHSGLRVIRGNSLLLVILGIGGIFGAFSEGFDRLWQAHFLRDFALPHLDGLTPVVWFGIISIGTSIVCIPVMELLRRRVDTNDNAAMARVLLTVNSLLIAGVVTISLAGSFALALSAFFLARIVQELEGPIYTAWLNHNVADSRVRATVLSMCMQANAVGQFAGGPIIGVVGTVYSLRAALSLAGAALAPALPLYLWAIRYGRKASVTPAEVPSPDHFVG